MVDRFLGTEARIVGELSVDVNNTILATWLQIQNANSELHTGRAMLSYFNVGDRAQAVELAYIYNTTNGNPEVLALRFMTEFFGQFHEKLLIQNELFRQNVNAEFEFTICNRTAKLLVDLYAALKGNDLGVAITYLAGAASLLARALECIEIPFSVCQVPACRFLAFSTERIKIQEACDIINRQEGRPLTIKELARKVAMNECYLKKGFKAITGKTINEYQQLLRMEKAKELLQKKGITVTDAAATLGFSSISHFSTAFKRATGMKPCELLA